MQHKERFYRKGFMSYLLSLASLVTLLLLSSLSSANDFKPGFKEECPRYYSGSINNKYEIFGYAEGSDRWIRGGYGYVSQIKSGKLISLGNDSSTEVINMNNLYEDYKEKDPNYFKLSYFSDLYMKGVWINGKTEKELPFEWSLKPGEPIKIGEFSKKGITVSTYRTEMSLSHHIISISVNGSEMLPIAQGDCYETFLQAAEVKVLDSKKGVVEIKLSSKKQGNGGHVTEINTLFVGVKNPEIKAWNVTNSGSGGQSFYHESEGFEFKDGYLVNITSNTSREEKVVDGDYVNVYLKKRTLDKYSIGSNNNLDFIGRQVEEFNHHQLDEPSKVQTFNATEVSPSRLVRYDRLFPGYER